MGNGRAEETIDLIALRYLCSVDHVVGMGLGYLVRWSAENALVLFLFAYGHMLR